MKKWLCCFTFIALCLSAKGQVITVGPTLHYYFLKEKPLITIGVEGTYHFLHASNFGLPGLVLGMEAGKGMRSLYGETQYTWLLPSYNFGGIAMGVFRKWEKDKEPLTGFQGTAWGWVRFAGAEMRVRIGKEYSAPGVGVFAKLPVNSRRYNER